IEKMVERMIVQAGGIMGTQIANDKSLGFLGPQISKFFTNSLLNADSIKKYVPGLTDTILAELGKPQLKQTIQQSLRKTFSATASAQIDMTGYSAILMKYGCTSGSDCRTLLTKTIDDEDLRIARY